MAGDDGVWLTVKWYHYKDQCTYNLLYFQKLMHRIEIVSTLSSVLFVYDCAGLCVCVCVCACECEFNLIYITNKLTLNYSRVGGLCEPTHTHTHTRSIL